MPGPEECFESKQALNARFRESNRNISPIEKDYHTNLKECKNDILFIAYYEGTLEHLERMVFEVNRSAVEPEDWLSDQVYRYNWEEQTLTVAKEKPSVPDRGLGLAVCGA